MDGFLKIEGIEGECKDASHRGWLDVTSFSWGMSQEVVPGPDGSIGAGTPTVRSAEFTQPFSRASVRLFEACVTGRELPTMTFEGTIANGDTAFVFLHVDFKDCLITKVDTSSSGAQVTEQIEVVFRSVNVQSKELPP